jgi:next-to-BRCA1 protein 1
MLRSVMAATRFVSRSHLATELTFHSVQRIVGVRHKCLACPDWDYCWSCIKTAPETHPGHRFVPIYEAIADLAHRHEIHYGIFCDGPLCRNKSSPAYITGVRYKCAVCHDTDFCAACEALPTNHHNRTHPLIKFKTPVRSVSVNTFGDDGIGGPTISMGDRTTSEIPQRTATSSSNNTVVAEEAPVDEEPRKQEAVEEEPLSVEEPVQPEAPQTDSTVDNEQTQSSTMAASTPASDFQAFFMRDTVRDGTKLPPNHVFQQTWTLYNPGPLAWPAGSNVRFVGGDSMFNVDTNHPSSVGTITTAMESNELPAPLAHGESTDFSVTLKTPQREGTSISYWRLKLPDGTPFGHKLWCHIQVTGEEITSETPEVKEEPKEALEEPKLSESNMIFPKLEKESPVSSTHEAMAAPSISPPQPDMIVPAPSAPSAPSLSNTDEQDVLEDVESLALEDVDSGDEGFFTDEEYDILDASDEDISQAKQG